MIVWMNSRISLIFWALLPILVVDRLLAAYNRNTVNRLIKKIHNEKKKGNVGKIACAKKATEKKAKRKELVRRDISAKSSATYQIMKSLTFPVNYTTTQLCFFLCKNVYTRISSPRPRVFTHVSAATLYKSDFFSSLSFSFSFVYFIHFKVHVVYTRLAETGYPGITRWIYTAWRFWTNKITERLFSLASLFVWCFLTRG